ncbi:hypothetical protein PHYSODRAFT_409250, partial [Phytophthora sojae]
VARSSRTLCTKLRRAWVFLQVENRGRFSVERLLALHEYTRKVSRVRVFLVCVGTPLPMVGFVLALECAPLQDPNAGWEDNYGLWIRCVVICGVIAYTMLVELRNVVEAVAISIRQVILVLICAMIGNTTLCMVVAGSLAFPIPFVSALMVPTLLGIVAGSLRLALG